MSYSKQQTVKRYNSIATGKNGLFEDAATMELDMEYGGDTREQLPQARPSNIEWVGRAEAKWSLGDRSIRK